MCVCSLSCRELSHPPPLLPPQAAPHITLGAHLRPPFLGMPSALCPAPGYAFLQPAEIFARQQDMLRKQNLARLEISAELLRQKELESLHQRGAGRLLTSDLLGGGLAPDHPALRSLHDVPEGHPLREELARRSNAMLLLRPGGPPPGPLPPGAPASSSSHKDSPAAGPGARKSPSRGPEAQLRAGDHTGGGGGGGGTGERGRGGEEEEEEEEERDEEMKESDSDADDEDDESRRGGAGGRAPREAGPESRSKGARETGEGPGRAAGPGSPSRHLFPGGLPPGLLPPLHGLHGALPFGFPYAAPYFHTGSMGGLFPDGEDPGHEDPGQWSVEDVCGFISSLAGCAEYAQVFREHAIDGETLALLTEEHLLSTLGLKLAPALRIRLQVARRLGRIFYMTSFPLPLPLPPPPSATPRLLERGRGTPAPPPDTPLSLAMAHPALRPASSSSSPGASSSPFGGGPAPHGRSTPKQENGPAGGRYRESKTPS
ncbi:sterile alpha motif domain-containing protein 11 [Gadus morhua]|uniref:sterile alpha motif domain-containing protein 11 n=1 Tax=Gadus morhua TaxID=8049 RepID=UPI0011B3DB60|nr:sterile alpha motif domain-containing protein 11 [Gadus morhua]